MRTSTALLLAAGVHVAGLVRREVHERRRQQLSMAGMHQRLCADTAANFAEEYGYSDLSATDKALFIHANRSLSLVGAKYGIGQLSDRTLRLVAASMMKTPSIRLYWERNGAARDAESETRADRRFHTIMENAFTAAHARAD
ncbi:DUF6082 family protein [Streptomyces seoulensis]|uniref:DUF6082 family protein n=1 Tax=Streptomyces seoulensis TaxID=73044 RepID=UPI001FCBF2BA|nr:DUF6082 family protein [Streptomyces seoulensis]BDH04924.1 hypothetical protein HEK131_21510 [Streptomyces seoulensis]